MIQPPMVGLPDHLKFFQGHFVFRRDTVGGILSYFHGVQQEEERNGHFLGNWTKN